MTEPASDSLRVLWRSRLGAQHVTDVPAPDGVTVRADVDAGLEALTDVDVLVDGNPSPELLDAPSLKRLIVPYAGIRDEVRAAVAARTHLTLQNSHFNADFVAQHAAALTLACANRLPRYDRLLRQGDWRQPDGVQSVLLAGRTAVLLGYGAIGRRLAPMLQGLGMNVEAVRRRPDANASGVPEHPVGELLSVLPRADVLIASLPGTPETRGLIDEGAFAALPDGAIVVNVGRGDVLDEEATWAALDAGRLAGLGIDVWWVYPDGRDARAATLPSSRPFHLHPDVVLSPHRANAVHDWQRASVLDVYETLRGIATGRDPERNLVDVAAGY